jgi:NAD+ kinase
VNVGQLGYLAEVEPVDLDAALERLVAGDYAVADRMMLSVAIESSGPAAGRWWALNEAVLEKPHPGRLARLDVAINGAFFTSYAADGVIVATPTGSTAYALSAGGPILDPHIPALALVPVAPHALTHRPIAVADTATIAISLERGKDAALHCDAQAHFALAEGERVTVRRAPYAARFLHPEGHDHFAVLREKLHWSETPERLRGK